MVLVATQVKRRRGTTAENDAFTGAEGEIVVDTERHELRVHDGVTQGGFKIGSGSGYHPDLFDVKWADHICNDVQWLRADTFSWQSGVVYQVAYQHLEDDIDGKTLQSETVAGTTIQFYLADDGHKICPASEESNVATIYAATGVAWYYIIDTVNTRFKLPRTKFAFTGIRNGVGAFVEAGLPNITGDATWYYKQENATMNGAFAFTSQSSTAGLQGSSGSTRPYNFNFDASRSSSIYGNSDTVQPKATEMYLYFYVGNFTQTALENTAGLNAELFNNKADLSTVAHVVTEFQEPTAANNYTWYRKYADGWVEQGGYLSGSGAGVTVSLPVFMADGNYTVTFGNTSGNYEQIMLTGRTTTTFSAKISKGTGNVSGCWQISGIAE